MLWLFWLRWQWDTEYSIDWIVNMNFQIQIISKMFLIWEFTPKDINNSEEYSCYLFDSSKIQYSIVDKIFTFFFQMRGQFWSYYVEGFLQSQEVTYLVVYWVQFLKKKIGSYKERLESRVK